MPTIFTKIINGEIPCHKVYEDEDFLAFLDIRPLKPGHTLVIPKKEVNYIFNMDDQGLAALMIVVKKVARMIEDKIPCKRIGVMVCGIEVPHAHVHLGSLGCRCGFKFCQRQGCPTGAIGRDSPQDPWKVGRCHSYLETAGLVLGWLFLLAQCGLSH